LPFAAQGRVPYDGASIIPAGDHVASVRILHTAAYIAFSLGVSGAQAPHPASPSSGTAAASQATASQKQTDARFIALYTAEDAWRRAQRGAPDEDNPDKILAELPSVDAATQKAALEHWQHVLAETDAIRASDLSPDQRINYAVFRAQILVLLNQQKFREYERPANSDSTFWSDEEEITRSHFKTAADYSNYIAQLNDIPRYFRENIANMRAGLALGFTPPRVTLAGRDASVAGVAAAKNAAATIYYKPFQTMPGTIPAAEQAQLRAQAATAIRNSVIPAYRNLLTFFRDDYIPHAQTALAAESLPDGKAYYQSKILEFTTLTLSPAQIHAIGLSEMAKIHTEMLAAMKDSGFKGTLPEFLQYLRTDPQFYARSPQDLLMRAAFIAKEFDGVASQYFGYLPRERFAIKPVPPEIAPFYTSARGGPGVYLVNTYDLPARGLYSLPALTLHESAPGHAFQMPIAAEVVKARHLPKFRQAYISAYGEGWALYSERLGTEMGMYHTPYETFGMLSYQAWRAARLVVDTGIHSEGWTREQAQQYLRENTALSDHEIETEVDRYISWPGQALSYYLGEMAIQSERAKAEAALGPRFNIRAFHDAVLELGCVPLPVLTEHIDQWIANGGVGPYPDMEK
jgi:uncharacterized protein (DUF885 family)